MKSLLKSPLFYGTIYLILYFIGYIILSCYNYTYFGVIKPISIIIVLITIILEIVSIYKTREEKKNNFFTSYLFIKIVTVIIFLLVLGYFLDCKETKITLYNKKMVEVRSRLLVTDTVSYYDYVNPFIRGNIIKKKMYYDKKVSKESYLSTDFFDDAGNLIKQTYSQNIEEEIEKIDVKSGSYNTTTIESFLNRYLYENRFNKTDIIRVRVTDSVLAGKDIIIIEKSTDNGVSFNNILENDDKYLVVNRDTNVTFVTEDIGFIFDLGLLGRDDRYKKFLVTTDGGKTFSNVSITISGYGNLDYYYINNTPRLKKDKLVLDVSVPVENNLKDIELVSNDKGLTFSN